MKPPAFLWGAATSAHQIEGYNDKNDWHAFEVAGKIEGGVRSGIATDHWNRFAEDIAHAAAIGLNSYRFSIEWSRIEPQEGVTDQAALDRYAQIITLCEEHGLIPMVTLHHFTSPLWFAEAGGFTSAEAPAAFARFAALIARTLGPRIPLWCTINEPMVLVAGTYLASFMPPGEYAPDKASRAIHGLLRAHALAYDAIHADKSPRQGPWAEMAVEVGIAHNMLDFLPERWWHPLEQLFAAKLARFYNRAWLDAVTGKKQRFAVPGVVPAPRVVSEALGRVTVDFLGINYYTKAYIQWMRGRPGLGIDTPLPIHLAFARHGEEISDVGWATHPAGFRKLLRQAAAYKLPIHITENGIADRDDRLRADYLFTHLREIAGAIEEGADIRSYYHWSLLDNFEWIKGFGPRFGLIEVDYETLERRPRASAALYRKIIQAHDGRRAPSMAYFGA